MEGIDGRLLGAPSGRLNGLLGRGMGGIGAKAELDGDAQAFAANRPAAAAEDIVGVRAGNAVGIGPLVDRLAGEDET